MGGQGRPPACSIRNPLVDLLDAVLHSSAHGPAQIDDKVLREAYGRNFWSIWCLVFARVYPTELFVAGLMPSLLGTKGLPFDFL